MTTIISYIFSDTNRSQELDYIRNTVPTNWLMVVTKTLVELFHNTTSGYVTPEQEFTLPSLMLLSAFVPIFGLFGRDIIYFCLLSCYYDVVIWDGDLWVKMDKQPTSTHQNMLIYSFDCDVEK